MANQSADAWKRGILGALIKLFHVIAAVQFFYSVLYDFNHVHVPPSFIPRNRTAFGSKFKYLTMWNAVSTTNAAYNV